MSGAEFTVGARQVVSATGIWSEQTQQLADVPPQVQVRTSKGVHLVIPRDRIRATSGLILRTEKSVLFVIPWGEHWIVGTTDTEWVLDRAHPAAGAHDVDYLLDHLNAVLTSPLTRPDVQAVYVGLRPLLSAPGASTARLSREHVVARPAPGLVVVAGGKYTTYRVMAADAVDEAARELGFAVPGSCTAQVPLVGADGYGALRNRVAQLASASGLPVHRIEHLLGRYGSLTGELLALLDGEPPLLGWDRRQQAAEVEHYLAAVAAERRAEQEPDDVTADAVRRAAGDIVPAR